jgi:4-carboxymuconolactone decarboxylase
MAMAEPSGRARVAPLAPSERNERQAALVERAGAELSVYTTLVRNPDLFADFLTLGQRLLNQSTLDARVRELLILRVAWQCHAAYIWSHHERIGRSAGVTDDDLRALARGAGEDGDALRTLILRVADELVVHHRLSDPTWADLAARYPTEQVIEACTLVGFYAMLAGTLNSLDVQIEEPHPAPGWTGR